MNDFELLRSYIAAADINALRLQGALHYLGKDFPLTIEVLQDFSEEKVAYLDLFTTRFSKLQDVIGAKIFKFILLATKEDLKKYSMIDRLNLLEQREFLPSSHKWELLRKLRNEIAHDYPNEPLELVENLNNTFEAGVWLLEYWAWLKVQMNERVFIYEGLRNDHQ